MKTSKQQKAQALLDAMSAIDDVYLNEALSYLPNQEKKHTPFYKKTYFRVLSATAALAAALALMLTGPLRGFFKHQVNDSAEEVAPNHAESHLDRSVSTLNSLLQNCTESPSFQSISADEINFFDGNVRLTVQRLDTQELYVSAPLTQAQQNRLRSEFSSAGEIISDSELSSGEYAVWITLGDGQVATPCLTPASGNVGAAVLFYYEAERLPSQIFFDLLGDLI